MSCICSAPSAQGDTASPSSSPLRPPLSPYRLPAASGCAGHDHDIGKSILKKSNDPQSDIHPAIINALQATSGKASASVGIARRTSVTAIAAMIMPIKRNVEDPR